MESAKKYAKAQKKHGHIALGVALFILAFVVVYTYFARAGRVPDMSILVFIGLFTIMGLFLLSAALFYGRYRSMVLIMENPIVHWKYDSAKDEWLKAKEAEAIISERGIYYSPANDKLHTFWSVSSKLESLKIGTLPGYDYMTMNFFFIRAVTYEGNTISASLYVPVPKGEEEVAEKLAEQLNQNLKLNRMKRTKLLASIAVGFIVFLVLLVIVVRMFF